MLGDVHIQKHEVVFCHLQKLTQKLRSKYKIQHGKSPKAKYGGKSWWHWTIQWFLEYDTKSTDKERNDKLVGLHQT